MQSRILNLVVVAIVGVLLATSAQAIPSVAMIWRTNGTATIDSVLDGAVPSSAHIADIVLSTGSGDNVKGVFLSIEFDVTELQAVNATELAFINLPGMSNSFAPISTGTVIDNGAGLVIQFDEATLAAGLPQNLTRTLGSVTFHVVNPITAGGIDVIASLQNPGIDSLTNGPDVLCETTNPGGCNFVGARVTPEPTTALLLIAGIAGLGYVGRRPRS